MRAILFWTVLLGGPVGALLAILAARRHGDFRRIDVGALLLPPVVFFVVALESKSQSDGAGLVLWPIVIALVCAYGFALKVFVADRALRLSTLQTSKALFVALSAGALALALVAPPWYE